MTEKNPDHRKHGSYVSLEERIKVSQDVKRSHFDFGHSGRRMASPLTGNQVLTTSHQFYGGAAGRKDPLDNRAHLRNKNRTAHFSIGRENSPFQTETTANASFNKIPMKEAAAAGAAVASGGTLKASNVNIGSPSAPPIYHSEAAKQYTEKEAPQRPHNKEAVNNLAAHHYAFGVDKPSLLTSSELNYPAHHGRYA